MADVAAARRTGASRFAEHAAQLRKFFLSYGRYAAVGIPILVVEWSLAPHRGIAIPLSIYAAWMLIVRIVSGDGSNLRLALGKWTSVAVGALGGLASMALISFIIPGAVPTPGRFLAMAAGALLGLCLMKPLPLPSATLAES